MATVRNTITMTDKMSPVLKAITRALNSTVSALSSVDGISDQAFNQARTDARNAANAVQDLGNAVNDLSGPVQTATSGFSNWQSAIVTANQALQLIKTGVQAVVGGLNTLSDMTDMQARLKRMAGQEMTIYELQDMIAQTADETRTSYEATAQSAMTMYNSLSAVGVSQANSVRLSAILNKQLAASGVKGAQLESVLFQLGQSLQSGKIRYEDWKLVQANAGAMAESVARAAGVTKAELNQMVTDGKVSATQFAQWLWATGEEIDAVYDEMPDTFADQMERMKTVAYTAVMGSGGLGEIISNALNSDTWNSTLSSLSVSIQGFFAWAGERVQQVMQLLQDPQVQAFLQRVAAGFSVLANIICKAVTIAISLIGVIMKVANFLSPLEPIIWAVVGAIAAYTLITNAATLVTTICGAVTKGFTAVQTFLSIGYGVLTGSTAAASAAQFTYNSALLACPITWIILLIIALIAIIFAVVAVINKATGKSISALGVIVGALLTAVAAIWNIIVGIVDAIIQFLWTTFIEPWIGIIEWVLNVFNGGFDSFGDAVKNLLGNIISWFLSLGKVVTKIIDAIFGTNWTAGLNSLQDKVLSWGKNENAITLDRDAPSLGDIGVGRWAYSDAWNTGYGAGEKAQNWIGDQFSGMGDLLGKSSDAEEKAKLELEKQTGLMEGEDGGVTTQGDVTIDDESIKLLKDVAAAEWVNKYTTLRPELKVTFGDVHETADAGKLLEVMETMVAEAYASALTG